MGGGGSDIAAATTAQTDRVRARRGGDERAALRIVLRHELFHYAARADTAPDAPRWLTEGVADFVGRPADAAARPARRRTRRSCRPTPIWTPRAASGRWPTTGRGGSAASSPTATGRRRCAALYVAACGAGHPDVAPPSATSSAPT